MIFRNIVKSACIGLALYSNACNKADFKSDTKNKQVPEAATIACSKEQKYTEEELRIGVNEQKSGKILVNGEFCPQAPARLNIVFLIDFSLSMYNEKEDRGNDPVVDGSCGRLDAARAIINSHKQNITDEETKITASVVQFSSTLEGKIEPIEIADFKDELTTENFCKGTTGTNYKVAFETATEMLAEVNGTKVVYLISDGMPTEGGGGARENAPRHRDAAQAAADEMRKEVKLLTYNTVYLGNIKDLKEENFDPKTFLEELTGSPERVKLVEKAENLAEEILKIEKPAVDIDTDNVTAELTAEGVEPRPVKVGLFKAHETKKETWTFATEEFDAFPGKKTESRLKLKAVDKNGEVYTLTMIFEPGDETKPIEESATKQKEEP
jgi:hypothetical protein